MSTRETVSPSTLRVDETDDGIVVHYLDGRRTTYELDPEPTTPPLRTPPGVLIQVLLVRPSFEQGVLVYVNDRDTATSILEDTGVGRINLQPEEAANLVPGVDVEMDGHHAVIDVDHDVVEGRVFVFAEGHLGATAHELIEAE